MDRYFSNNDKNLFVNSLRNDMKTTGQEDKLVFITTTQFALDQVATLTKIAQSLYPVRNDGVLWVIVSLTEEEDLIRTSKAGEGKSASRGLINHRSYK